LITVRVRTIGLLKSLIRQGELDFELPEDSTVQDVLDAMAQTYGPQVAVHFVEAEDRSAHPPLRVTVNGRDIAVLGDRQTVLSDGDDILVLTPIAGG
jgi:molybdopterin converting factor small subunit